MWVDGRLCTWMDVCVGGWTFVWVDGRLCMWMDDCVGGWTFVCASIVLLARR